MSTAASDLNKPPREFDVVRTIVWIFGSLVGISILFTIVRLCIRKMKLSTTTDLQAGIHNPAIVTAPPVQVWQLVDAATMERFLHDMAREKSIRFTAQELHSFTMNYSTRLGSGGFGVVYQGQFPNGIKIAVKVLSKSSDKRVEEQFMAEVGTIGRTYHINLVRLYGFCFEHKMTALVYEYMENGSLDKFLFSTETPKIEWEKLQEIAIGTAKGIAYLHEECQQRIIHYDIKPGNVLLDMNLSPKVADFGLAKLCNRDNTHVSITGYRGTPGYSAPEFLLHNYPITHKCDVYSFGMLLFEIVRRRRNVDSNQGDSLDWFPKKVWEEYGNDGLKDLTMEIGIEEKDREKAERMFMVALWCVQDSPDSRPLMSTVVKMLEGGVEIMPPSNPFRYLYSVSARDVVGTGSNNTTTTSNDSTWYKDSTPIMGKYEIQMATSS
ncbi:Protein kinase domain [Macleaya cordata]|uniref:Protein kinase domain n=1 Tax=Macleaya cordata TaxID=56857 RepID=A0A200R0R1_MACCD|nr:Protein kinase domain [Macleaya cordata]